MLQSDSVVTFTFMTHDNYLNKNYVANEAVSVGHSFICAASLKSFVAYEIVSMIPPFCTTVKISLDYYRVDVFNCKKKRRSSTDTNKNGCRKLFYVDQVDVDVEMFV